MEAFPFVFVALLALCIMPSAPALKCEVCSNVPGFPGAGNCDDSAKVTSMTCPVGFDRCITVKGKFEVPSVGTLDIQLKNCSNSFIICDKNSDFNMCKILNITGMMPSCSVDCCEGDMCNEAVRLSAWLASFTAILLALYMNVFN